MRNSIKALEEANQGLFEEVTVLKTAQMAQEKSTEFEFQKIFDDTNHETLHTDFEDRSESYSNAEFDALNKSHENLKKEFQEQKLGL